MEYKGYHAAIEYDAEDNIFIGEVFGLADSLNFCGTPIGELQEMFEQSIDNYLELCAKIGKQPEKEFKGSFNVRIPKEMHKRAALEAAKQKITLNQYVTQAIQKAIEEPENVVSEKIYVPYIVKNIGWNLSHNEDFNAGFRIEPVWKGKEAYAG